MRHPERGERLFGDVVAIGGYPHEGRVCVVGLHYPDGARVGWWSPKWSGEELNATVEPDHSPLIDDLDAHDAWVREAAQAPLPPPLPHIACS